MAHPPFIRKGDQATSTTPWGAYLAVLRPYSLVYAGLLLEITLDLIIMVYKEVYCQGSVLAYQVLQRIAVV
jgi:hypothetical protein